MSTKHQSTTRTLFVALIVSLVSSVFVAGSAVVLKPIQLENRQIDKQRNILSIAGIGTPNLSSKEVKDLFTSSIKARVIDIQTGEYTDKLDPLVFDPLKAARDPSLSTALPLAQDIALIKRRERYTTVYMVEKDGKLESLILPIRGYGLENGFPDSPGTWLWLVVNIARIHCSKERPENSCRIRFLSACRNSRSRWRG